MRGNHGETLIDRMARCEPKRTALLLKIMERPAMYFGTTRFDYMEQFLSGYDYEAWERRLEQEAPHETPADENPINENREMEYWLLHTHSATFHGSLSGYCLFARCFGCGREAFDTYRMYLCSCFSGGVDSVYLELFEYESAHNIVRYDWEDDVPIDHNEKLAQAVVDNITEMLRRAGLAYDQLKVYVRRDNYFLQVRFLIHNESGWTDDSEFLMNPDNHDLLLAIHAHAEYASEAALIMCGFDVFDTRVDAQEDRFAQWPARHDLPYDLSFASDYDKWKNAILNEA